jgi:phage tail-like protein
MGRFGDRSYRFSTNGHWRVGATCGFAVTADGLTATPPLAARRIAESEAGVPTTTDSCGRLVWLRPETGELIVLQPFGAEPQGRISVQRPLALHVGPTIVWVRCERQIHRFATRGLQTLGAVEIEGLVASASDGADGLWVLMRDADGASVRQLDAHGRFRQRPIRLGQVGFPRALAADPVRRRLAVLDMLDGERAWRLHIVDLARGEADDPKTFPLTDEQAPPASIIVDDTGAFRIASAETPGTLLAVSAEGVETAHQTLALDAPAALRGLLWHDGLVVCADRGLFRLAAATSADSQAAGSDAVFITPTLTSPPGTTSGWNRAEMTVELPRGARLAATIFSTSSIEIADAFADLLVNPAVADRVARIKDLFASPNVAQREQYYAGEGGEQQLHLLLDRITAPYLWLRLRINSPASAGQARIRRLRVRYPDKSWLDELPAIYSDDQGSAAQLRQFLAPFEALYGELDETIDALPAQIHPDTAPDTWLSWLLGWLGFPPTTGLHATTQRALLKQAGDLLERRGTIAALRDMLQIVTGNPARVEDAAATAGFWVIGAHPARFAPRLGRDTMVVGGLPGGFRPGGGMRLGEEPLPPFCTDLDRVLRARCGLVTIRIALDPATQDVVRPIVESLLAMFVPAHCRIDLRIAAAGRTPRGGRLNGGWRLAGDDGIEAPDTARLDDPVRIELGTETAIGTWQLPSSYARPFTIDGKAALDGGRRLA